MSSPILRVVGGRSSGLLVAVDRPLVVGREGDVVVDDPSVSRRHLRIEPSGSGSLRVTDLGSSGGTAVDGVRSQAAEVAPGGRIGIGMTDLVVLRFERYADLDEPTLLLDAGGRHRLVSVHGEVPIGREATGGVVVDDPSVSRMHAVVRRDGAEVVLEDLGSSNGTTVDGRPVHGPTVLTPGVRIGLGRAGEVLTLVGGEGPRETRIAVEVEGDPMRARAMAAVDADPTATVAQVTHEVVLGLGLPDGSHLLYRSSDGVLLHPDDRWASTGVTEGDLLVLGRGDATAVAPGPKRRLASARRASLNQLPRTVWPEPPHHVPVIEVPESTSFEGRGVQWQVLGGIGSILVGLLLVFIRPEYWAFGLITGAVGTISIAVSVLGEQSRRRHQVATFRERLARLDAELRDALVRQAQSRRALWPDLDELASRLRMRSPRIWERRPGDADELRLRLGIGTVAAEVEVERGRDDDRPLRIERDEVLGRYRELRDVPIVAPGPLIGSLGVSGPPDRVRGLVARMVLEAALLHPPEQLRIWVAADEPGWEWCRWLPHVADDGVSGDAEEAAAVVAQAARRIAEVDRVLDLLVVVADGRRLDLAVPLDPVTTGVLTIVTGTSPRDLPGGLRVTVSVDERGFAAVAGAYPGEPIGPFVADAADPVAVEELARLLSRRGAGSGRSRRGGLVELLGLGAAGTVDPEASWATPPAETLSVPVGVDGTGAAVTVGMRRDGPHGMVAGTTGSGKSELLQTLLAALALRHGPDRLNLFLIDFKGGSTFAPLAPLPHVAGLVTDLESDATLALRAFTALDAEMERRKRFLDQARVADVVALERAGDRSLPDLLVVIDELALLVERQPEVKDRLDTVAAQGRSLGVHLLLATQSPNGVITHAIRSNTNLWMCLRVVTDSESMEILGARDAARIPDRSPGRAIIRRGASDELRPFQAARVARPTTDEAAPVDVRFPGRPPVARSGHRPTTTELDVIVGRMVDAARRSNRPSARPLWLPPLPERILPRDLPPVTVPDDQLMSVVGLLDDPAAGTQDPAIVDLSTSGHLLVCGLLGSGTSNALAHVGLDLASRHDPRDLHLYGIDAGAGELRSLDSLPHLGDVVPADDPERLTRLIDRLSGEVTVRRDALATASVGGFLAWRRAGGDRPWIVVLVDDYPVLRETAEQVDSGRLLERFGALLQGGPAVGIHLVLATPQPGDLRTRELNLVPRRIVLRSADPADLALVDVPVGSRTTVARTPGRGITNGAAEIQVCALDHDLVDEVARRWTDLDPAHRAPPVRRLPARLRRDDPAIVGRPDAFAVGGPEVEPIAVDLGPANSILLVAGPRGSGRSSTLAGIVEAARHRQGHRSITVVALRPGPLAPALRRAGDARVITEPDEVADALSCLIDEPGGGLLVIDDAESLQGLPGVADRLDVLVRRAAEHQVAVVVAARTADLPSLFDPWLRYVVSLRQVVVLQPTNDDFFLFGARPLPVPLPMSAGRGVFVDGATTTVLQVAEPVLDVEPVVGVERA